jgi:kynurenine 3-monooxygenase
MAGVDGTRQRKAVVVGAGPVGCLAAIALANRGWAVDVYERRAGVGRHSLEGQRSINMVLSSRGLAALSALSPSLAESVMEHTIPVHSRMVHTKDGGASSLQYDPHRQVSPGREKGPMAIAHLTVSRTDDQFHKPLTPQ